MDQLGTASLTLTVLVGYIVASSDYEYLINSDENFQKKYDIFCLVAYFCECLSIGILNQLEQNLQPIFIGISAIIQMYVLFSKNILSDKTLEKFIQSLNAFILQNSVFVFIFENNQNNYHCLSICVLITIPSAYKLADLLVEYNINKIIQYSESQDIMQILLQIYTNSSKEISLSKDYKKFDAMTKQIILAKEENHLKNNLSQILKYNFSSSWCLIQQQMREEISLNGEISRYEQNMSQQSVHNNSEQQKTLTKSQFQKSLHSSRKQNTEKSEISQFQQNIKKSLFLDGLSQNELDSANASIINQIFLDIYHLFLEEKTEVCDAHISMLCFILHVVNNYQLFWMRLNQILKLELSLKNLQILKTLEQECDRQIRIQLKKQQQKSIFYAGYLDVIYYDNLLNETALVVQQATQQKLLILDQMKRKNINLSDLSEKIQNFLSVRSKILQNIKIATKINPGSRELDQICADYCYILSFSSYDLKKNKLSSNMEEGIEVNQMLQDKYTNYFDSNQEKFSSNACVIYISLKQHKKIQINQVSSNFLKIFNFKKKEDIMNQPLEIILPQIFAKYHSLFIKNYFSKDIDNDFEANFQSSDQNKREKQIENTCVQYGQNQKNRMVFAVSQDNHLIAVKLDVKVNRISINNEFGLTAHIQQVNKYNDYILFRSDNFSVVSMTKLLHSKVFKVFTRFKELKLRKYFAFLKDQQNQFPSSQLNSFEDLTLEEYEEKIKEQQKKQLAIQEKYKQYYKNEFDYILVVKRSKQKGESMLAESNQRSYFYNKFQFFKLRMSLKDFPVQNPCFENQELQYIEITSIKRVNPRTNQRAILEVIANKDGKNKTNIHGLSPQNLSILFQDLEQQIQKTIYVESSSYQQEAFKQITMIFSQSITGQNLQITSEQADSTQFSQENQILAQQSSKNNNNTNKPSLNEDFADNTMTTSANKQKQQLINDGVFMRVLKENMNQSIKLEQINPQETQFNHNKQYFDQQNNLEMKSSKPNLEGIIEEDNNFNNSIDYDGKTKDINHNQSNTQYMKNMASAQELDFSVQNLEQLRSTKFLKLDNTNKNENSFRSDLQQFDFSICQNDQHFANNLTKSYHPNQSMKALDQMIFSPKIQSDQNLVDNTSAINSFIVKNNQFPIKKLQSSRLNQLSSKNSCQVLQTKSTFKDYPSTDFTKHFPINRYYSNVTNEKQNNEIQEISDIDEDEDDVTKRRAYKIYSDETTRKNNFTDQQRKEILETSSAHSKVSSIEQIKKQFRKTILTKKSHYSLSIVNGIGLLSIIVIFIVNFQQFFQTKDTIGSVKEDFTIAQWPMDYNNQIYGVIEAFNLKRLTAHSKTNLEYTTGTKKELQGLIKYKISDCYGSLKSLIKSIVLYDVSRTIVSIIYNYPFQFNLRTDITGEDNRKEDILDCKLGYCLIQFQNYIFRYIYIVSEEYDEYQDISNFSSYSEKIFLLNQRDVSLTLRQIFIQSIGYNKQSLEDIKSSLDNLVIIITIISAFCISLVIPLYALIQTYREKILSLLTTFSIDILDDFIDLIDQYYILNLDRSSSSFKIQQKTDVKSKQIEVKKQNLSYYSKLPKVNKKLIFFSVLILTLIVLYPVLNRQLTRQYIDESQQNLSILYILSRVKSYILLNVGLQYFCLTAKLFPGEQNVVSFNQILDRIQVAIQDQDEIQQDLNNVMQGSYLKNRHSQSDFNDFFIEIMTGDPCSAIVDYTEYVKKEDQISAEQCQRQQGVLLKNGLLIALKSFMNHFKDVYYELKDVDKANLQKINIFDYNEQIFVLVNLLDNLTTFIQIQNEDYYDYIIQCQIYLMLYQFFALTVVFYLSWILFYKFIDNQLHQTKLTLSFLHVTHLISNPYIQSYFQQKNII
ncbi:transmembrane protein, putative (macronuclear) [Tetrahymena thermophila SB210]|uniref:Transmembrane protein, putative n=1 Tax=Tetrahymena thermophila (strain SB210) TaxID=312017 RepID=Q24H82_TETTS|nr:transmembrane protein, putative [Tetrahymena thermophila SB210]EAS07143.2 transmembrane protein, putative [Tetrahymena thermophila SB210]|eukprot:XP_001027385.2 transmembrane protein, putative [Tetrahymena thermophila SB210]